MPRRPLLMPAMGVGFILLPFGAFLGQLGPGSTTNLHDFATDPLLVALLWVGIVVITFLNALFVAGEVAVDLLRTSHIADQDDPEKQKLLARQFERKENVAAACVLGALTMRSWLIFLCLGLSPWIAGRLGLMNEQSAPGPVVTVIIGVTVVLSIVVMFFNVVVELVAKTYAVNQPAEATLKLAQVLRVFDIVFRVPSILATKAAGIFTNRFGTKASFSTDTSKAEEEIKEILGNSEQTSEMDETELALLQSVFEFGDTVARSIMTPRVDVEAIPLQTDLASVASLVEATGHSRFPVYEETDDNIVGIIHAKDVLRAMSRKQVYENLSAIVRPALFVPESKPLHDLLAEMRAQQAQMVIVQDEFGGTSGIVTIEDIVEELVGEIIDEYDVAVPEIVSQGNVHHVSGKFSIEDLNDVLGTEFSSEEFDSVGGYIFGLFGRQPRTGEWLDHEGYRFTVEESDGRRIMRLKVEAVDPEAEVQSV